MWMGQYLPHHKDPPGPAFLVGIMATPQTVTQWVSPPLFGRQDGEVGIISQVWILKALSWAGSRKHRCAPHPQGLHGTLKFEKHGSEAPSSPGGLAFPAQSWVSSVSQIHIHQNSNLR